MPFHVFLSHSSTDKPAVEELARRLEKEGIQTWLDKWHLIPGDAWQPAIEKALAESETCAVFVGPGGFGPWQNEEMRAAIDQRVRDSGKRFRVIPVLLPGAKRDERSSLPTFLAATTWVEFHATLGDPDAFHRLVCGIRGVEPGTGPGQALYEGQCPYRGLRVFDVDDAPFFFGREALVQWLLSELRPAVEGGQVNRFLAIVGSSGSGKSSVARAGLVAAIRRDDILTSSGWPVAICRPGADPVESLAVALSSAVNVAQSTPQLSELIAEFHRNEKTLHLIARQSLPENTLVKRLVIVVDQFEEIFTLCHDEVLREAFVRNLLYAAKVARGQTMVILTMRADFYGKCAVNTELAAAFSDHHVLVGPLTEDEVRRAIERPAQLVGSELETGLVDLLVQDVRRQPGALPLLQHALLELWNKREGRRLTVKAYQEIGQLEGALQRRADATLKEFSEEEKELCRRTFLRLTQPGEGTEDTKRRALMQELLSLSGESRKEEDVIQKLANASLLTTEGDFTRGDAFVEVAHEALIRGWPQLRKWIDADRAGLRTRTRLTESAHDWKNSEHDPAYLYNGARLASAEEWDESHPGQLSTAEAKFLRCSREAQQQREATELEVTRKLAEALRERAEEAEKRQQEEKANSDLRERLAREEKERQERELGTARKLADAQQERAEQAERAQRSEAERALESDKHAGEQRKSAEKLRRRAFVTAAAAGITMIFLVVSVLLWLGAREETAIAEDQAHIAESRRLAEESLTARVKYPERSLLLAVEAANLGQSHRRWRVAAAEESLREALGSIGGQPLVTHQPHTVCVAISPEIHWLATGNENNTTLLWDLSAKDPGSSPVILRGPKSLRTIDSWVDRVAFSADNHWLATACDDTAQLWDLSAKDPAAKYVTLRSPDGLIGTMRFSPDNHWLLTGGFEKPIARLWDLTANDPAANSVTLLCQDAHTGDAYEVDFSPDNRWLVTAGSDNPARLWDLSAKNLAASAVVLRGQEHKVTAVGFSADGHWLVTGSDDNTARLWDLSAKDPAAKSEVLRGHEARIDAVAFSPDSHWLATGSDDNTARLWDLSENDPAAKTEILIGHRGSVNEVAFSPDNHWLVTGSSDNTARRWDLRAKDPVASQVVLRGHEYEVAAIGFSPDNNWLVTASSDGAARLWDLNAKDAAASPLVLRGHTGNIDAIRISPDNHWLVTGSWDDTARLWDLSAKDPAAHCVVLDQKGWVTALGFSPDNHWLATAGGLDNTARLWDLTAKDPAVNPIVLRGHEHRVTVVGFSADGRWLATGGSDDGTARLWDLRAKDPAANPVVLRHDFSVSSVGLSPDSHWLVTGSLDGTARLYDLEARDFAANPLTLRAHGDPITAVGFSRDSRWLVIGGFNKTAWLRDLTAPAADALTLRGHEGSVTVVGFSLDNHWLVTAGLDEASVRLWDLKGRDPAASPVILRGHEGGVNAVSFSPDNHWLVTAGTDGTARLWDLTAEDPAVNPVVLRGHANWVTAVDISSDNHWLVTGSWDQTARLWPIQVKELIDVARVTAGRNFSTYEWELYFPGEKYRRTFEKLPGPDEILAPKNR
jgi:WD40 repeat protein